MQFKSFIKNLWSKIKSAIEEKAISIVVSLLFTLLGSGLLHWWGIGQLNESKHKEEHQQHRADSLEKNCIKVPIKNKNYANPNSI